MSVSSSNFPKCRVREDVRTPSRESENYIFEPSLEHGLQDTEIRNTFLRPKNQLSVY